MIRKNTRHYKEGSRIVRIVTLGLTLAIAFPSGTAAMDIDSLCQTGKSLRDYVAEPCRSWSPDSGPLILTTRSENKRPLPDSH